MHSLTVKLPDDLYSLLEKETRKAGKTKSEMIRTALKKQLTNMKKRKDKVTFLDQARDLCGSINGPTDLSTNSKHMEGFGK